ncbi:MAG: membrane protein insertion efficiency factor YidD [Cyanosarcina radialis HA8281-LM2]|jgi:putative component of membrane protein insertase Oxa1/YidC/SpoIIIJ protein YidD|nr:membrane protein insertion efficiency factor YidD [Cyanosarcina radialis HA8281-LM2]
MTTNTIDTIARQMAIASIGGYQTYISPRKGFACPHRLLHGGESCSTYIKQVLGEQNLLSAIQTSVRRFQDCNAARETLKATPGSGCLIIPCCIPI